MTRFVDVFGVELEVFNLHVQTLNVNSTCEVSILAHTRIFRTLDVR